MNWESKYDEYVLKMSEEYFEERFEIRQDVPFEFVYKYENIREFLNDNKTNFLNFIVSDPLSAFRNLQSQLPILAEHLIYCAHKEQSLSEKDFCKCFLRIYLYAAKGKTLFKHLISYSELVEIFSTYNFKSIMDTDEKKQFEKLQTSVALFRGSAGIDFDEAKKGISWSLNYDRAEEFALYDRDYFNANSAIVIDATISKKDILVFSNLRGEYEVIINPDELRNIRFRDLGR